MSSHHSYFIPSLYYHSYVIPSFLGHFDHQTSFRCHPIILTSFGHYIIIPMSFHHSYVIPSFLAHSFCHSNVFLSFPVHSDIIPSLACHSTIPWSFCNFSFIQMSFHHSSVIPSITFHVDNIPSFWCHSIHSSVIRALEWRGMTFWWNDRNEVGMMISVIQMAFLSFSSSQISGGNVVFLDFIPVILTSFHHSGVIQKVSLNRNDVRMTENFGPNSTTFPNDVDIDNGSWITPRIMMIMVRMMNDDW